MEKPGNGSVVAGEFEMALVREGSGQGSGATRLGTAQEMRLHGRMGILDLVSIVLAYAAPVVVVSAFIPYVIVFDGIGAPFVFLVSTALLLLFAVGFTTMTRYLSIPGAFYAYVTAGLGRAPGLGAALLAIFGYLLLGFCTLPQIGLNGDALAKLVGGPHIDWYWYALAMLGLCGVLAHHQIDLSAKVLTFAMGCEVLIVLVFDLVVGAKGGAQGIPLSPFTWTSFTSGSIGIGVLFAVTCFLGFEATAVFREEVREPNRTIPKATYLAVLLIGGFYVLAAWMIVAAYGTPYAAKAANNDPTGMFSSAMIRYVGAAGNDVTRVLIFTSLFSALLSAQNVLARYFYNLGVDGVLPKVLSRVHPRHNSPYVANFVVTAIWVLTGIVFAKLGTDPSLLYGAVAGVGGFALLIVMTMTSLAVVIFFRRASHINDSTIWHTVLAPLASLIGMASVVVLAIKNFPLLIGGSETLAVALQVLTWGVLLVGIAMAGYYRVARPEVYRRIGRET
jgi:amino acid transporter